MATDVLLELRKTLTYLLFPAPCLACGGIDRDLERPLGLCLRCRGRLVKVRDPCCATCARPLGCIDGVGDSGAHSEGVHSGYRCGRCRLRRPRIERLTAHWVYQEPLDRVVLGLKFRRLRFLGEQLGAALAERLGRDPPPVDAVVPVPLHWRRQLERGYNQADEIARAVATSLTLPRLRALRRRRSTRPQMELPRDKRDANLQAAFICRSPKRIAGRAILLVDDVLTTGATLDQAARCLQAAGSGPIFAAVVARTPEPGEARPREVTLTGYSEGPILDSRRDFPTYST